MTDELSDNNVFLLVDHCVTKGSKKKKNIMWQTVQKKLFR